uniref:PCNA-associated factor n=1 Tax=Phallusia mammillata TaxID=59560 RepID=A0A6F9DFW9_9ASCI|nr:PCNA-associated factor-like [Phallusia mammillata]
MVRTKANTASASVRVAAEKAPRKNFSSGRSSSDFSSPSGKKEKHSVGGNPVCARPTPTWQKPIASFFTATLKQQPEKPEQEKNETPKDTVEETSPQHFHDDKENRNPIDEGQSSEQPEAATSSKTKRRRILMVESDSEEETTSGCIVSMEDSISAC